MFKRAAENNGRGIAQPRQQGPRKLLGVKPTAVERRLKVMFYGEAGCGKTTAAINFPKPYFIDCEKSGQIKQYAETLESKGGLINQTSDFDTIMYEIETLLTIEHPYQTLIIDPITNVWNSLLAKCADEGITANDKDGTAFGRHRGLANKRFERLTDLLLKLDMNVIITAHQKKEYNSKMDVIGKTFDAYAKLDHIFDLVLEVKRKSPKERIAIVQKTRFTDFEDETVIKFSYDEIARLYGKEVLERNSVPISMEEVLEDSKAPKVIEEALEPHECEELVRNAQTLEELRETYRKAYKYCKGTEFESPFREATEKRKQELENDKPV